MRDAPYTSAMLLSFELFSSAPPVTCVYSLQGLNAIPCHAENTSKLRGCNMEAILSVFSNTLLKLLT